MTTAAFRAGILAADKLRHTANGAQTANKIRLNVGRFAAFVGAGQSGSIQTVIHWLERGGKPDDRPVFSEDEAPHCLAVTKAGKPFCIMGKRPTIWEMIDEYTAIGAGGDFAIGAMACGKSAEEAVKIACMFNLDSGRGVDVWKAKRR